mmetsp:Transcript_44049/g.76781  ORF Transcript_44049/g.76781 Transcript_44049/m.76781 type:complete len:200 (-) Transcript_44049:776-1375(-)
MPTPRQAPDLTKSSPSWKNLSIWFNPSSTFHIINMPRLAAQESMPCPLFLNNHCVSSAVPEIISLSLQWAAFTKAFTKVDARFARALSTAVLAAMRLPRPRVSTAAVLYTSSGVRGVPKSRSRMTAWWSSARLALPISSFSLSSSSRAKALWARAKMSAIWLRCTEVAPSSAENNSAIFSLLSILIATRNASVYFFWAL